LEGHTEDLQRLLKSSQSLQGVHNRAEEIQEHLRWAVRTLDVANKRFSRTLFWR